ncbi:MAG: 1-acyl-sn-glycerol-3-phosphate acyltransferase [Nitrospirae bacterium]|nr:1-acyl-sn-glycerol-3-phosphate acyltransferase [Nitrospirota bacterium]
MISAEQNSYRTDPDRPRSIFSRIFLSPRATFYFQAFWIIWKNSRKARKGLYTAEKWAESSFEIIHALENIGAVIEISGLENLRNFNGPAVFISNHMSTLETLVLPSIIQPLKPVTFVVKESLVRMPVFGPIMRSRDPILVGRTNAREDLRAVLEGGTTRLRNGQSIVVFPQSTRSSTFNPEEFNTLGIKLALKANVPVIPIALKTDAWGIGKRIKNFGPIDISKKIHVAFGERLTIQNRGTDEHLKVINFITEQLNVWNRE